MDTKDFLKLIKQGKGIIISLTIIFLIIGLIVSLAQPLKYRSRSRLLIVQPNASADAYTVARSNEYIGSLISRVIYSGSFLDSLKSSNTVFDRNYFSGTYKDSVKKWNKTVFARSGGDTGIIDIEMYHTNPEEAKRLSLAVNQLITSGEGPYKFESGENRITVIDQPVVSTFPVKPNLPVNLSLSLLFGFLAACSYIYLFPEKVVARARKKVRLAAPVTQTVGYQPYQAPNQYQAYPEYNQPYQDMYPEQEPTPPTNLPFQNEVVSPTQNPSYPNYQFKGNISNVVGE